MRRKKNVEVQNAGKANLAPAQKRKGPSAPSILGVNLSIKGTIDSDGDMQLDGHLEGNVRSSSLTIGDKAVVDGDVMANDVVIRGRVNGNIRARTVKLSGTAHVIGDILQKSLAVESGAVIDGRCKHVDDPLSGASLNEPKSAPRSVNVAQQPAPIEKPSSRFLRGN